MICTAENTPGDDKLSLYSVIITHIIITGDVTLRLPHLVAAVLAPLPALPEAVVHGGAGAGLLLTVSVGLVASDSSVIWQKLLSLDWDRVTDGIWVLGGVSQPISSMTGGILGGL